MKTRHDYLPKTLREADCEMFALINEEAIPGYLEEVRNFIAFTKDICKEF